jgi:hypothetical protein
VSRPVDWTPLDLSSDPVPGDPPAVQEAGRHYQEVADAIESAARRLREIADHAAMQSLAVDAMRDRAHQVADDIERAHTRYRGVGDALVAYATPLLYAQDQADRARLDAILARQRLEQAQARLSDAESSLTGAIAAAASAPDDAPAPDHSGLRRAVRSAHGDVAEAQRELESAKQRASEARDDRDRAADTAVGAIREVENSGDLNDSWWDDTGAKVVAEIAHWAGAVAAFAGVAALVVGWIPVIGQALALALGTIALVAAAVSLLANLSLALTDYGSWSNVLLDVVGLATFGIGRAVIGGARAAYRGAQATARLNARGLAATSRASRGAAGLPTSGNSATTIRSLVGGHPIGSASRAQARTIVQASRSVPSYNLRAPFTTAWKDLRSLPANFATLTPGNLTRAWQQGPAAFTQLRSSATMTETMARLTQNSDTLAHVSFTRTAHQAVQHGDQFTRAARLTDIQVGATSTAFGLDSYQLLRAGFGPETPAAQQLRLDREPRLEVPGGR